MLCVAYGTAPRLAGHPGVAGAGMVVADGSPLPGLRAHTPAAHMLSYSKAQRGKFRAQANYFRVQPHASSTANTFYMHVLPQ